MNTYKKLVVALLIFGLVFMLNQFDAFGLSKVTDRLIQTIKEAAKRVSDVFAREQDTVDIQKVAQEFPELEEIDDIAGIQKRGKEKNIPEDLIKQLSKDKIQDGVTAEKGFDKPFIHPFSQEYADRVLPEQGIMGGEIESEESANWDEFMQHLMDGIYVSPYEEWFKEPENEESEEYIPPETEEYSLDELLQDIEKDALLELRDSLQEELELTE